MRSPFTARPDGTIDVRLSEVEAQTVRRVAADMGEALAHTDEPSMHRLFPPAYPEDAGRQEEFARFTRDELLAGKRAAIEAVIGSIDEGGAKRGKFATILDDETAGCWLRVLNDARLVLGTRLDISEEEEHRPLPADHLRAPAMNLYLYLSGLTELLVEALAEQLPPADHPI